MSAAGIASLPCFKPELQQAVRDRFCHVSRDPFGGERIYLENAGGGFTLEAALEADRRLSSLPDNAGRDNPSSRAVDQALARGRADLALFFNAPDGTILSDQSTTACAFRLLEAAAAGARGGNLVCSRLDHASFYDATHIVAERHGLEVRVAEPDPATGALDPATVAARADARTVAVTLIHASNITGGRTDLAAAAAAVRARAPQAFVLADGAQHAQHGAIDVTAGPVDAYVFSAYKVFSKPGFGFAYISPRLAARPRAQLRGKKPSDWDLGTRDPGGFAAFSEVLDYLGWLATESGLARKGGSRRELLTSAWRAIEEHEAGLCRRLLDGGAGRRGLRELGRVKIVGSQDAEKSREAVFALQISGMRTGELVRQLGRRGIVTHDRVRDAYSGHTLAALGVEEVLRVSFAHYNTPEEVDRFLEALGEILG